LEGQEFYLQQIAKSCLLSVLFILLSATVCYGTETVHIVKAGDSLWAIASKNGVSVDHLKKINGLKTDSLQIGDRILISQATPVKSSAVQAAPAAGYMVRSGDSLWSIATRFNLTVARLKELNGLTSDFLQVGQKLNLGSAAATVALNTPPVSATPSRSGENIQGDRLIEAAAQYLGVPYSYGGQSPSGFDCSGFTSYVFQQFGYSLPRTAAGQYGIGTAVAKADLEAGDLVFFACGGAQIDHVGIYCGNSRFIHSSSPRSGGVIYSSLLEGYYGKSYVGARRIVR
jgi:peptidoglycan endopeptidase LytE